MLPMFTTAKSTIVAAIAALSVAAVPATPALAWGKKEQGFVAGVATAIIIDELLKQNRRAAAQPLPAPVPVYVPPAPTYTSIYATPAARAFNTYSLAERKAIQRKLRAWGYYHGGIDGAFGPGTYNAVVAYARNSGSASSLSSTGGAYAIYDGLIL